MEHSSPPTLWSLTPEFGAPADVCLCTPSPRIVCWTSHCAEVAVSVTRSRPRSWGCLCWHVDVDPDPVFHSAATAGGMTLVIMRPAQVINKRSAASASTNPGEVGSAQMCSTRYALSFLLPSPTSPLLPFSLLLAEIYFSTKLSGPFRDF